MPTKQPSWNFYPYVPGPSISGDIARLFNTGDSTPPAVFARLIDADKDTATSAVIYGREGIANCVDASIAARKGQGTLGLDFHFEEFSGQEARDYWNLLDLRNLADRTTASGIDRVRTLGLSSQDCLTEGPGSPLRILTVIERAGGGMPGALSDPGSVLLRARRNVGDAQIRAGAAGSYGYGKAAVAQASRPRILVVYTCSQPDESPDGVTRRLLGITYWGKHNLGGVTYNGWGIFGTNEGGVFAALEDEEADAFAESLDLPVRSPADEEDFGTTFMILDPMFGADELKGAIEIFWWPLLQQSREVKLDLAVYDEDGNQRTIDVDESHPELGQFVSRFMAAEQSRTTNEESETAESVVFNREVGICSFEKTDPNSPVETSMVALMRSPLMVVSYQPAKGSNQPVVGVFVAHDETNENLRRVEPPEHDKWLKRRVAGLAASAEDLRVSKSVSEEISNAVRSLRAPEPAPVTDLTAFSKFFPAVEGGVAKPKPPRPVGAKKQRLVHVNLVHSAANVPVPAERPVREPQTDGQLRARAVVRFWLDKERAARVKREFLDAKISIGARIQEDGATGDWLGASVRQVIVGAESRFAETTVAGKLPATFEGRFLKGEDIFFEIETDSYLPDWTVDLVFDCSPWDVIEPKKTVVAGGE